MVKGYYWKKKKRIILIMLKSLKLVASFDNDTHLIMLG